MAQVGWLATVLLIVLMMPGRADAAEAPNPTSPNQPLVQWDFTAPQPTAGWKALHDCGPLSAIGDGLHIPITGHDPYLSGPAMDLPENQPLWLRVKFKSDQAGSIQIFYFTRSTTEENSVRASAKAGWNDVRIPLPALGKGYRLRIDPPGSSGSAILNLIEISKRRILTAPKWPAPDDSRVGNAHTIRSGELSLAHSVDSFARFDVTFAGTLMGRSLGALPIGYLTAAQATPRWCDLRRARASVSQKDGSLILAANATDPDGGTWNFEQRFTASEATNVRGTIEVETRITSSADRDVLFLPLLMISAGAGAYGPHKIQALFSGLEYLDKDEPSSSESDIVGPEAQRQIPDALKITIPLMAIAAKGRYIALTWQMDDEPGGDQGSSKVAALFDSPDRLFSSGGSMMGLVAPGAGDNTRPPGNLLPYEGLLLKANTPLVLKATILAGKGESVVPAVQHFCAAKLSPLPKLPDPGMDLAGFVRMAAAGWQKSAIREGNRYRHAYPGTFNPQPAADAAYFMTWLAERASAPAFGDPALADQLSQAAAGALAEVAPDLYRVSGVGHVRQPVAPLIFGNISQSMTEARQLATRELKRFEADGSVLYRRPAPRDGKEQQDLGKTHFAPDANGLASNHVVQVLNAAAWTGDRELAQQGLRLLDALNKFDNTVPRGAQTWEMPLHTPDILASAHLVHAYVMGYELTGDRKYLDRARYWAWTGVPFLYLRKPASGPVGLYATTPCWGATNLVAPNWMGLPVQWCGLVYANALYRLAIHDSPELAPDGQTWPGFWKQLADGIVISGIQQSFGADVPQRCGLLPDSFSLRAQLRNDPGINPATVQADAGRVFGLPPMYDYRHARLLGWNIHAPGAIEDLMVAERSVSFIMKPWTARPCRVLVSGVQSRPMVLLDGQPATDGQRARWDEVGKFLVVEVKGQARFGLQLP